VGQMRCGGHTPVSPRRRPRMRIRASSSGSTSANRSKKGPNTVEKLASVPPISTSGLCTELCARSHHSGQGMAGFADEASHTSTDLDRAMVAPAFAIITRGGGWSLRQPRVSTCPLRLCPFERTGDLVGPVPVVIGGTPRLRSWDGIHPTGGCRHGFTQHSYWGSRRYRRNMAHVRYSVCYTWNPVENTCRIWRTSSGKNSTGHHDAGSGECFADPHYGKGLPQGKEPPEGYVPASSPVHRPTPADSYDRYRARP
jgi:hypothetical protein